MAEPSKETASTPPPPPQETVVQAPATVEAPSLETDTPISASQDNETVADGAGALDSPQQPKAESAHQPPPPPPQETVDMAAVGAPEQTTTEADGQPPVANMPQNVAASPTPAETPAAPAPPPPPPPPPQKQEGGVPERASSAHEEKEDAPKARAEEEGEKKKLARRRWRCLRAAVCLMFLCPKSGQTKPAATPPGDKQPASGPEEEKKATAEEISQPQKDSGSAARVPSKPEAGKGEGETKPAASMDGKLPEPGKEQVATLPPPAETSSQETTAAVAAEAEKQVAAPGPHQPPLEEKKDAAPAPAAEAEKQVAAPGPQQPPLEEKKDAAPAPAAARPQEGEERRARRLWRWLQTAVRRRETKPPPGETPPLPVVDSSGKPATEKGEDEMKPSSAQDGKKLASSGQQEEPKPAVKEKPSQTEESKTRRRDETETQAGKEEGDEHPMRKKLRQWIRLVQILMSWFNKNRSPEKKEPDQTQTASGPGPGVEEDGKAKRTEEKQQEKEVEGEKSTTQQKQHRNWPQEEVRLEGILEEAFARLVAAEYVKELHGVRQKCLLTFSVFDLASEVKKQAMIYWWVAEFNLRHRNAESIFFMLSDHGFLVPMKNWCSKVIHGCQVNPLVHWMLKRQARGDRFADLDDKGSPKDLQLNSGILCLTAGNRPVLQRMRMKDEPQPQAKKQDKGKGSDAQDQQQSTTKDESKSMAAAGAPSKDDDAAQAKDQQPEAKDQQQQTTKDEAHVGSKSIAEVENATSQKEEDPTDQAKNQLTTGAQNIKLSSKLEHIDEILPQIFKEKQVVLNINAHVYPISRSAFSHLAECLVVLQLGRWNNLDDKTYMEVVGLDSQNAIGLLKNLRYLGLRGLSRLTELPKGIENLKKLVILDMRGCQNLVKVEAIDNVFSRMASDNVITQQFYQKRSVITQLKQLTHLDLTECYMLEHIGRGITSLTELQVFKGFVFATGTQGNKACRIQDLEKLKKLQKLTVSITTDANVANGEMAHLKNITSLQKLTVTWSEIPSILDAEKVKKKREELVRKKREELVRRWTSFQLPEDLMKLDIRCYPKEELELEWHEKLKKLYLRGGEIKRFFTKKSKSIKTLRLRYLKNFKMEWKDIRSELENIEYVEIKGATRETDKSEITKDIKDDEVCIEKVMKIPEFTLDRHGVWIKDHKEEHAPNKDASKI